MEYDFRRKASVILALTAVLFAALLANGQGIVTGSISGAVVDPQGAVLPGAKVTGKHLATNREFTAVTTSSGVFALRTLPPGTYDLKIEVTNFRSFESKGLVGGMTHLWAQCGWRLVPRMRR